MRKASKPLRFIVAGPPRNAMRELRHCEPDAAVSDQTNRAWSRACGEFFSLLYRDGQYLASTLQVVGKYFDVHPEFDVVFGDYIACNGFGIPITPRRGIPFRSARFKRERLLQRLVVRDLIRAAPACCGPLRIRHDPS